MKILSLAAVITLLLGSSQIAAESRAAEIRLLDRAEASHVLGSSDPYTRRHTDFDRAARLGVPEAGISEKTYLDFAAAQTLDWDDAQNAAMTADIARLNNAIVKLGLKLDLPREIDLIKTSGKEDFNASYTRGAAIIFPSSELKPIMIPVLAHELFHVYSRHHPERRDALYALIGFRPMYPRNSAAEFVFPPELKQKILTNPDAYEYRHVITVQKDGVALDVFPVIVSDLSPGQITDPGAVFRGLRNPLLVLEQSPADGWIAKRSPTGGPLLIERKETNFMALAAPNTGYTFHPEETIADNFALMILDALGVSLKLDDPELLKRLAILLRQ